MYLLTYLLTYLHASKQLAQRQYITINSTLTVCDGRTDGRTDRIAVATTALSKAVQRNYACMHQGCMDMGGHELNHTGNTWYNVHVDVNVKVVDSEEVGGRQSVHIVSTTALCCWLLCDSDRWHCSD